MNLTGLLLFEENGIIAYFFVFLNPTGSLCLVNCIKKLIIFFSFQICQKWDLSCGPLMVPHWLTNVTHLQQPDDWNAPAKRWIDGTPMNSYHFPSERKRDGVADGITERLETRLCLYTIVSLQLGGASSSMHPRAKRMRVFNVKRPIIHGGNSDLATTRLSF